MRIEHDSLGKVKVPSDALYGASTQRAVINFPISGHRMPERFIRGLGLLKLACANANEELGRLSPEKARFIGEVARKIADGELLDQFPVDVFQTGSGTSTNTNANEVIANCASQLVGEPIGSKRPVHPNDDVNLGQSSNDIMPTALNVSVALAIHEQLLPALRRLHVELARSATEFAGAVKVGRTHLMDAVPLTLGQEFSGYAAQVAKAEIRAERARDALKWLAIGGTAVGTGLNTHPEFAMRVCLLLSSLTGLEFCETRNHFEAQGARDDAVEVAGLISTISVSLAKIASDLRLLGSGPRAGFAEIRLPATQPGSSIMPGKVNPVMCEMLIQVCLYAQGLCQTVVNAGRDGQLELNATIPLMAHALHESIGCLANAARVFAESCVHGIKIDDAHCGALVDRSLMLVTALTPHLGYDKAAAVTQTALAENRSIAEVVRELGLLDEATLKKALDPRAMTGVPIDEEHISQSMAGKSVAL